MNAVHPEPLLQKHHIAPGNGRLASQRHQNDTGTEDKRWWQCSQNQQGLIDGSKPVGTRHDRRRTQGDDQIAGIEIFTDRSQQTACALHKNSRMTFLKAADPGQNLGEPQFLLFPTCSQQRGQRRTKMPGIYFVQRQSFAGGLLQGSGIIAAAGADRFEGDNTRYGNGEATGKPGGQRGFSNPRISAGDE